MTTQLSIRCKDGRVTVTPRIISSRNFGPDGTHQGGRPMAGQNTIVVRMANERSMRLTDLGKAMGCSERAIYNYTTRRSPVPTMYIFGLCDELDVDPEEIIDNDGYFKLDVTA